MNNKYRIKNISRYARKTSNGNYSKTILVGCVALIIAVLIIGALVWLVSSKATNNVTETAVINDNSLPKETQATELSATTPTNLKTNSSPAPINDQLQAELITVIKQATFLDQLSAPYGFASDPIHHRLIWTSGGNEAFMSAKSDGSEITKIQSNFEAPYLIRIETPYGHKMLFYSDGSLRLREIDSQIGTSSELVLLTLPQQQLHGLGFDDAFNTVYIGDQFGQASLAILIPADDEPAVAIPITLLKPK